MDKIYIDVNNVVPETSKIKSNDDTRNVVVRSKEKSVEDDLITDNDDKHINYQSHYMYS